MSPFMREAMVVLVAAQWLAGLAFAHWAYYSPQTIPRRLRGLIPSQGAKGARAAGRLALQALGWMLLTALVTGLYIPILPIYTVFRWFDSFNRAAVAIELWPDRSARGEREARFKG